MIDVRCVLKSVCNNLKYLELENLQKLNFMFHCLAEFQIHTKYDQTGRTMDFNSYKYIKYKIIFKDSNLEKI